MWVNNAMTTVSRPPGRSTRRTSSERSKSPSSAKCGEPWPPCGACGLDDRGSIVNVGSALAFVGIPLQSAYCASKFACRGFFESTRAELLHEHSQVRLSMVHLPAVNTTQFGWCQTVLDRHPQPVPPIYQPETAALKSA